jgi:hypothetical protein
MEPAEDLYSLARSFPPNSPRWSLVDAFDAVTNGIENPESFLKMEAVSDPSLGPWKSLIRGIRALYGGDIPACRAAAEDLGDNTPPGALKPLFRAWLSRQGTRDRDRIFTELSGACDAVANLYRRLLVEPHPLSLMAEQAEEALRQGLAEQFEGMALRILKSLRDQRRCDGPLLALRYAQRCLILLDGEDREGTDFIAGVIKTLGEADGFCLLAFTLIGRDNRAAAAALRKALAAGDGLFPTGPMAALLGEVLALLEEEPGPAGTGRRGRKGQTPVQLELFGPDLPPDAPVSPGMDRKTLREALKNSPRDGTRREDGTDRDNAIDRLDAALRTPASFDELEWELPPAARYLGPGVWMDAIKRALRQPLIPALTENPVPVYAYSSKER